MIKLRTYSPLQITCKHLNTAEEVVDYVDRLVEEYEAEINKQHEEYNRLIEEKNKTFITAYRIPLKPDVSLTTHEIMEMISIIPTVKKKIKSPRAW